MVAQITRVKTGEGFIRFTALGDRGIEVVDSFDDDPYPGPTSAR